MVDCFAGAGSSCALLTKEMAVVFSALVGIYAWLYPAGDETSPVKRAFAAATEAAPYAVVTLAYVLLRKHALLHSTGQFDPNHGMLDVARTLPLVLSVYLRQLVIPLGITGSTTRPTSQPQFLLNWSCPVLVLVAVLVWLWYWIGAKAIPSSRSQACGCGLGSRPRYICGTLATAISCATATCIAVDRIFNSGGSWVAAAAVTEGLECAGGSVLRGGGAVQRLCVCIAGAAGLLGKRSAAARARTVAVSRESYTMAGLAKEYSQRGAHEKAIALAEATVRDHPEYGYGPLALAESYIHAGRYEEGRQWLERVNPEYAKSEVGMAGVAGLYGQMGDYDRALALCSEILEKEPDLYSALYNCGNIHLMDGQYKDAEQLLSRAVQLVRSRRHPDIFWGARSCKTGGMRRRNPICCKPWLWIPRFGTITIGWPGRLKVVGICPQREWSTNGLCN